MIDVVRLPFLVAGLLVLILTLKALVTEFLIPRPSRAWVTRINNRVMHAVFRWLANRTPTYATRDRVLSAEGPATILVELLLLVGLLLLAITMMVFGISDRTPADSAYQAGSTLLTLGILEPVNHAQIALALTAAFLGLVVVAVLIGYLMTLSSSFTERERLVASSAGLMGEPPWGPELLCREKLLHPHAAPDGRATRWIDWCCDVRAAQTVNPVLNAYRSPSPLRSWVTSLLAVLDSATLQVTCVRGGYNPQEIRLILEGTQTLATLHAMHGGQGLNVDGSHARLGMDTFDSLGDVPTHRALVRALMEDSLAELRIEGADFTLVDRGEAGSTMDPGISRDEFDFALQLMERAGIELVEDVDAAWPAFAQVRQVYARHAHYLAESLYVVPAPWSGDRHPATPTLWPHLSAEHLPAAAPRGED